jgi:3-hydroxyisobutyrate dehydrogenase-like beta-hydroxyacid dehydrogenase
MLADDAAVDRVYGGDDGLAAGARPGIVLVDCSTVSPGALRRHESAVRARGAGLVDAPVSGSTALAEAGTLSLMVGGEEADIERAGPILDAISSRRTHVGPLGTGHAMKLAVNAAIFGHNQAIAEGLVLAKAAGIDPAVAYDVLAASVVGSAYVGYKRAAFLEPEATPVAFALDLAAKDLRLIGDLAGDLGLELPQAAVDLAVIEAAAAARGGDRDFSTVAGYLSERRHR